MIKVVCGIIYQNQKILICRRKPDKNLGGFWEFPGGKIEKGERNEESLRRELWEELQMEVKIIKYYGSSNYDYKSFSIELIAYECRLENWSEFLSDHDQFEWVAPEDLLTWKLAPADILLASTLERK